MYDLRCGPNSPTETPVPIPTIRDIMILCPPTISLDQTVRDAEERMLAGCTSRLYAVDGAGRLCGVVTDYALLKHLMQGLSADVPVEAVVSRAVPAVAADAPLMAATGLLRESCCSRIAVTEGDHLIGEITRIRVLRQLSRTTSSTRQSPPVADSPVPAPKYLTGRAAVGVH